MLSDAPSNSYLEQKKREYRELDRLQTGSTATSPATLVADSSTEVSTKQVPLGNSVTGELARDIVWSEGLDPSQTRGIIYLSEPLIAEDGTVALEARSSLIVEVESINSSGLAQLNAVAVSYENSEGKLVQEALPANSILIQGEEGALIAERSDNNAGSTLGQDLLLGALGAGEKAFDLINEPEVVGGYSGGYGDYVDDLDDIDDSEELDESFFGGDEYGYGGSYGFGSYTTRANEDSSLITGAAEGAFATTKRRLEDRSRQIEQEHQDRNPIYQLKAGTEVTIFVNSFLTIEP